MNEKYSYLIVQKNKVTPNVQFSSETEAKKPFQKSYFWPRIMRPVIRKHQHIIMDLCSEEASRIGNLERRIIAKSHGLEGGYRMAKKVKWGDLWYF